MKEVDGFMIFVGYVNSKEVVVYNILNCVLYVVVFMLLYRGLLCKLKKYGWIIESYKNLL